MLSKAKIYCGLALALLGAFLITSSEWTHSQQNVPVSIKLKDAFILSVDPGGEKLLVDLGDNVITTDEAVTVNINSKTAFLNKKKKPVDVKLLRPGVLLEIDREKLGTNVTANKVTVLTNLEDWEVTVAGYFERLDGDQRFTKDLIPKLLDSLVIRITAITHFRTQSLTHPLTHCLDQQRKQKRLFGRPD